MRKRKKVRQKRENFYLGVALYTLFSIISLIFIIFIFSGNFQPAGGVNHEKIAVADVSYLQFCTHVSE